MQTFTLAFSAFAALQTQTAISQQSHIDRETWLSIVGGGLAAAVLTLIFNVWWDRKKTKSAEDWEFKRYRANVIHHSRIGLMEAFFTTKSELEFLTGTLELLVTSLNILTKQAEEMVKQSGGQNLTVAQLEQQKNALLQPFQQYNSQQIALRWNQHEQKANELQAKAETILNVLQPLIPHDLFKDMMSLYGKLNTSWVWDLPRAKERLQLYKDVMQEFQDLQMRLSNQLEVQLGRKG